jgi:hypothetical protein
VVQEESHKIYFKIFGHSYNFLQILEVCPIFWNFKTIEKRLNPWAQRQCVAGDLEGGTGEVPGKEEGAGAHRSSGSTARWCK